MLTRSRLSTSAAFSDLVTCFVINLDSRPERWQRVERNCRRRGISPIRFGAHDGDAGRRAFPTSPRSPAELGLWSSFRTVVESDVDTEWILVLEDDAYPPSPISFTSARRDPAGRSIDHFRPGGMVGFLRVETRDDGRMVRSIGSTASVGTSTTRHPRKTHRSQQLSTSEIVGNSRTADSP